MSVLRARRVLASLAIGARAIPPAEVVQILLGQNTGQNAVVITELRMPRTLIAIVAGAALGVAGALIQAVTRNPLADPYLFGVSAGASRCAWASQTKDHDRGTTRNAS